jgi:3',5'-cyclic-AMP phosphodiesterase
MGKPPLEVQAIDPDPIGVVRYLNAARGGGTEATRLVIERGALRGLPPGLDAIIATSDLQGVVPDARTDARTRVSTLLGCAVAEALEELAFDEVVPAAERTGVVLAGDLYSVPGADKRGGFGDVAEVWAAFAERFAWVAGVAGNHDDTSGVAGAANVHLLDASVIEVQGLRIGGVGLIAGNPAKRGRRSEEDQLERLELVAAAEVDLLLCHEGPSGDAEQHGHAQIRELLEEYEVPLTICGHVHWGDPLARHRAGQILNVDARVIVLVAEGHASLRRG